MKKLVLFLATFLLTVSVSAQKDNFERANAATAKGTYVLGINSTGLGFSNQDNATSFNAGLTLGGFVQNRFAILAGLGYGSNHDTSLPVNVNTNNWYYGAGLKYYLGGVVPLQVDWRGSVGNNPSTSSVGAQLGFAIVPFTNFSIEPNLRYSTSLKNGGPDVFSGGVDFNLFF